LLIEGAGGLFVPLGEGYTAADVIKALRCEVIVVAANRLGCINHTLLTIAALRALHCARIKVVLSNQRKPDLSAASNEQIITEFIRPVPVLSLPYLGRDLRRLRSLKNISKILQKSLAPLTS
jgi:dethiobiotin synthetase